MVRSAQVFTGGRHCIEYSSAYCIVSRYWIPGRQNCIRQCGLRAFLFPVALCRELPSLSRALAAQMYMRVVYTEMAEYVIQNQSKVIRRILRFDQKNKQYRMRAKCIPSFPSKPWKGVTLRVVTCGS